MRRRNVLAMIGGCLAVRSVWAQQPKVYRFGYFAPAAIPHLEVALFGALADLGYVEGKNLRVEYRYGEGEALKTLAAELVELQPDLLVTVASSHTLAAGKSRQEFPS
jgi:putative ABC transport system substrate-binding protein